MKMSVILYGPSSFRVGQNSWEIGQLNRRILGFSFIEYKGDTYVMAGGGLNGNVYPALFAAFGYEWNVWSWLSFRLEANTAHGLDNYSQSEVNIGASFNW